MTSSLHRSKLFWLGLSGLLFLIWAWSDSRENSASINWQMRGLGFNVGSYASQLNLGQVDGTMRLPGAYGFNWQRNHFSKRHGWLQPLRLSATAISGGTSRSAALPYWLVVSVYLAAWLVSLAHRHRRRRRASQPHPIIAS